MRWGGGGKGEEEDSSLHAWTERNGGDVRLRLRLRFEFVCEERSRGRRGRETG